jgi:hypothetical protein
MEHKFGKMSEIWADLTSTFQEKLKQLMEQFAHLISSASAE